MVKIIGEEISVPLFVSYSVIYVGRRFRTISSLLSLSSYSLISYVVTFNFRFKVFSTFRGDLNREPRDHSSPR